MFMLVSWLRLTLPLFNLTKRPPTSSTLFPYTTLFRSWRQCRLGCGEQHHLDVALARDAHHRAQVVRHTRVVQPGDRKSTRLNSSHVEISYAVFCLKKKKNYLSPATYVR